MREKGKEIWGIGSGGGGKEEHTCILLMKSSACEKFGPKLPGGVLIVSSGIFELSCCECLVDLEFAQVGVD